MKRMLPLLVSVFAALSADAAPSASPSASSAPAAPAAKLLEVDSPSAEVSAFPKLAEWRQAHPVRMARSPSICRAMRLREWLRVVCTPLVTYGLSLVSGDRKDVYFWVNEQHFATEEELQSNWWDGDLDESKWTAEVILPLRRGDRRLIQIVGAQNLQYYGGSDELRLFLSEHWLEDEPGPVVTID